MKVPKLKFQKVDESKYEAIQDYGLNQIIYTITALPSCYFLLNVENVDYNNPHFSVTIDDAIRRANEINESLMLLMYNKIAHDLVY